MPDRDETIGPVTVGEVYRAMRRLELQVDGSMKHLETKLDSLRVIAEDRYLADAKAQDRRIEDLERFRAEDLIERKALEKERKADRKWIITAVALPILLTLFTFIIPLLTETGGG